jgi:hypothetical protein
MNKTIDSLHENSATNKSLSKENHTFGKFKRFDIKYLPGRAEKIAYEPLESDFEV